MVVASEHSPGVSFGKYVLLERLGRGGMAEVWKAKAHGPKGYTRKLVVKRILPELARDDEFVRMFIDEARLCASLNHRNIVQVYEFGEAAGEYYLAMEWVHGRDLNTLLKTLKDRDALPPVELAAYVAREVCRALAYAHSLSDDDGNPLRLIHRDVSPSNVMLGFDGSVKLLDFGIAKALAQASQERTQVGMLKGKFGYMAPEQVEDDAEVDHRADLFVVGIVLWEMLTLRRLFKGGNDVQTIGLVRKASVLPPSVLNPAVPRELDDVVLRALARDRDERFADCGAMAEALDDIVHSQKLGAEGAARLMRTAFPEAREPTQQIAIVAPAPEPREPIEPSPERARTPTPTSTPTPTAMGELFNAPTRVAPPPPSRTVRDVAFEPTQRLWQRRTRRRVMLVAATVAFAAAGALVARIPTSRPAAKTTTAPLRHAPWLTTAAAIPTSARPLTAATTRTTTTATPTKAAKPDEARVDLVTVRVTTKPPGASVSVAGEDAPRGVTPLVIALHRSKSPRRLVLEAPGYAPTMMYITPDVDARVHFDLERATRIIARHRASE